ncbi:MAG: NADPH-dependent FMN reductase, partial [Beijerinckiaceae bacterium]
DPARQTHLAQHSAGTGLDLPALAVIALEFLQRQRVFMATVLILSGSERAGSLNLKLADLAAKRLAAAGATVARQSLKALNLPVYDGDSEAASGPPQGARDLRAAIEACDGLFIASPEYNAGVPPLLKNALDWASRCKNSKGEMTPLLVGKVVALGAASPSPNGGLRNLVALRTQIELGYFAQVVPDMVILPDAGALFADDGELTNPMRSGQLDGAIRRLLSHIG